MVPGHLHLRQRGRVPHRVGERLPGEREAQVGLPGVVGPLPSLGEDDRDTQRPHPADDAPDLIPGPAPGTVPVRRLRRLTLAVGQGPHRPARLLQALSRHLVDAAERLVHLRVGATGQPLGQGDDRGQAVPHGVVELGGDIGPVHRAVALGPQRPEALPLGFGIGLRRPPVRDAARHHCRDDRQQDRDHLAEPLLHQDPGRGHQDRTGRRHEAGRTDGCEVLPQREPVHRAPQRHQHREEKEVVEPQRRGHHIHGTLGQKDRQRVPASRSKERRGPHDRHDENREADSGWSDPCNQAAVADAAGQHRAADHAALVSGAQDEEQRGQNAGAGLRGRRLVHPITQRPPVDPHPHGRRRAALFTGHQRPSSPSRPYPTPRALNPDRSRRAAKHSRCENRMTRDSFRRLRVSVPGGRRQRSRSVSLSRGGRAGHRQSSEALYDQSAIPLL